MHLLFLQHFHHEILVGINASNRFLEILEELWSDETLDCDYAGDYVSSIYPSADGHSSTGDRPSTGQWRLVAKETRRREDNPEAYTYLVWTL